MRQKKRCSLAEDILKNFPGDSVFLYPNLGEKPKSPKQRYRLVEKCPIF